MVSTNYGKPVKMKGYFKMLQDKGVNVTNYIEQDGAGRTITHEDDEDEEYEEDDY